MGKGNASFRMALKLGSLINSMPDTDGKPYQECGREQKTRMLLELAFKEMTGISYTQAWFEENKMYL